MPTSMKNEKNFIFTLQIRGTVCNIATYSDGCRYHAESFYASTLGQRQRLDYVIRYKPTYSITRAVPLLGTTQKSQPYFVASYTTNSTTLHRIGFILHRFFHVRVVSYVVVGTRLRMSAHHTIMTHSYTARHCEDDNGNDGDVHQQHLHRHLLSSSSSSL